MSTVYEDHQNLVKVVMDLTTIVQVIAECTNLSGISRPNVRATLSDIQERLEKMYTYDNTL